MLSKLIPAVFFTKLGPIPVVLLQKLFPLLLLLLQAFYLSLSIPAGLPPKPTGMCPLPHSFKSGKSGLSVSWTIRCKATSPLTSLAADQTAHRAQDSADHLQGTEDFKPTVPRRPPGDPSHFTCRTLFWCATSRLAANMDWTCEVSFRSRSSCHLEFTTSCSSSLSNCFDL